MEFFPFALRESNNGIYQCYKFIKPRNIFTKGRLEQIISKVALNPNISNSFSGIQGVVGENIARDLFSYHMKALLEKQFPQYQGKLIRNDQDYIIKKQEGSPYIAKLLHRDQVVILGDKKELEKELEDDDEKFGLKNIAELDGLYHVKKQEENSKNGRYLIVLETKTGSDTFDPHRIQNNIINPLQELYKAPVGYLVIGFEDELYSHNPRESKKLNEKFQFLYETFQQKNIPFSCIHFPFEKKRLVEFSRNVEQRLQEQIHGNAIYDIKTGMITLKDAFGRTHSFNVQK